MSKHSVLDDDLSELDYDYVLPPDTSPLVRGLCYLCVLGFAALGFWCVFLMIFGG